MTSFLKYKNLIDESINQLEQFEEAIKQLRQSHSPDDYEEETNNLLDSISSFILELLQESKLMSDEENKCSLLKTLAIKAVCLINWNLNELEKEIPFVELCDLMDYLVFLTNLHQDCTKSKTYRLKKLTSLDLIKLEKEQIFVLQFYLRWNLRLKLSSKNHYCGKLKNKKLGPTSTKETIDYLEFFFKYLNNNDLYKPVSSCFSIRNDQSNKDVYNFDLNWNNMIKYDKNELRNIINYDLGMYFFQQEEYEEAFYYFHSVKEYKNKLTNEESKVNELDSYANELESYLIACKSMLNIDIEDDSCTTTIFSNSANLNEDDVSTKQVITKMVLIENCIKNNLKNVFTKIPEESFLVLVQKMNHKNIDKDLKKKFHQFMELIMETKDKEFDIDNEEEGEHQFEDDDEDYDEDNEENFDNEDEEFYPDEEHFHQHEKCCSNHSIKLPSEELRPIDFFHQMENLQSNQTPKSAAQRKKEKRKLKKKLKKLQKEENMDTLSTTASTTSTNTTTTTSTVNVNEIINQKGKDLKLIRKKLNKEAKEQAEKELEKQLQKIVNSGKKSSQSQNQNKKDQVKSEKKKKNKKKNNQQNSNKQTKKENKAQTTIETFKEEQLEIKEEKQKSFGDLDDFSEQKTVNKLNDLDDFETVKVSSLAKLDSLDDFSTDNSKIVKINELDNFYEEPKNFANFRKLIIPDDIFARVVGTNNSNLSLIEKITSAKLNLDKYTVEISADSMEYVEFALELLHTLIDDPKASLAYLLPVECKEKVDSKPVKNETKSKTVSRVSKSNTMHQSEPVTSKISQNAQADKPKNFAEAVAKKPINNTLTKITQSQVTNAKDKILSVSQPILASSKIHRPVSVVQPFKNDKIAEKLEDLKIEVNSTKKIDVPPPSTPIYSSQSPSSFSSSTSSSLSSSEKLEQKQESVYNAISQLWSFNESDLVNRLSPFLSTSSKYVDKINTTKIANNMTVSKPIGYERNGKLQQTSNSIENQSSFINPISDQRKMCESIVKPMPIGYQTQSAQTNQWLNYHAYFQQEAAIPFTSSNYIYQNYGLNNFGLNGGYGMQLAQQTQPNIGLQSTAGNHFPQQQYRY